ncbi:MAG: glycosyltransferase [Rhodospirillaceae bacterium]|jgi:glycosyltransferase involved in cell wall biosynthesis|nr:glycosyltransferase [Rhodospirillaceae bacterium]MBT5456617.1 glycosyltransferase [Rhodospirillaceae bacterium]
MKVLRLIGSLDPRHGGPPVSSLNSCIAVQRAGAETTFAFPVEGEPSGAMAAALGNLRAAGVDIITFPASTAWGDRGRSWGFCRPLARWVARNRHHFDLIHCHGAWQMVSVLAARGPRADRQPILLTPHESLTDYDIAQTSSPLTKPLKSWLRRYFIRRFDLFVVASNLEARHSLPPAVEQSDRVAVIPHPVMDGAVAATQADTTAEQISAAPGGLHVGYLGRLHRKKNVDLLLDAISRIDHPVSLTIAGTGPEEKQLRKLAFDLGLGDRVTWLGFIEGPRKIDFFRTIDVLALPSDYECFGMAAAEALAVGIPVIASAQTGIAEIVRDQGGGHIIEPNRKDIEGAIRALADDPGRLAGLAAGARNAAQSALSFSAHGDALYREYERLAARR